MNRSANSVLIVFTILLLGYGIRAQADDICSESGLNPGLDSPFAHIPYVFGKVVLQGFPSTAKPPKVTVILYDGGPSAERLIVNKSGNYCFKRKSNNSTLVVEVDGNEAARRTLASFGSTQQREDFEIFANQPAQNSSPAVISAKFTHPANPKTTDLYKKAIDAEINRDPDKVISYLKQIVAIDPEDFIAWAKLGIWQFAKNSLSDADAAFRRSLELKVDYTPAWVNVGQLRIAQKRYEAAIPILQHAAELDPTAARTFQLLGEAYLLTRQGTLGAEALKNAIKLDPIGMAECHLQLAHLYQLAGAKPLAAAEYRVFLTKVPDHPHRKKFEKFIKDNP
ncbi:MAG TPA: hypothetical protein PLP21_06630 [Pyrinomonadaceae bacterium]|nr:hypothetical protein [Acidobacteriota bacterium]HQZ95976.1 hypothetical protein [Pyrinomonadaceae bacterium]